MRRVHAVFLDLQPVALPQGRGAGHEFVAWQVKGIQKRKRRLLIRWPHIGEEEPCVFAHRIGAMKQAVLQRTVDRLARRFEAWAVDVEQPAVIATSDTLLPDQAELERGAPMRAMQFQQSNLAPLVAERDEILPENANSPRQLAQFAGEDDRLPKAAEIFSTRRVRPDAGQFRVIDWSLAMVVSTIGGA